MSRPSSCDLSSSYFIRRGNIKSMGDFKIWICLATTQGEN